MYIDPHKPDGDYLKRREARREGEARQARKAGGQQTFDDVLFARSSTYNGSKTALARLRARRAD